MKACTRTKGMAKGSCWVRKQQMRFLTDSPHTWLGLQNLIHGFVVPPYQTWPWTQAVKALWGRRGAADPGDVLEDLTPPWPRCCLLVFKTSHSECPRMDTGWHQLTFSSKGRGEDCFCMAQWLWISTWSFSGSFHVSTMMLRRNWIVSLSHVQVT